MQALEDSEPPELCLTVKDEATTWKTKRVEDSGGLRWGSHTLLWDKASTASQTGGCVTSQEERNMEIHVRRQLSPSRMLTFSVNSDVETLWGI